MSKLKDHLAANRLARAGKPAAGPAPRRRLAETATLVEAIQDAQRHGGQGGRGFYIEGLAEPLYLLCETELRNLIIAHAQEHARKYGAQVAEAVAANVTKQLAERYQGQAQAAVTVPRPAPVDINLNVHLEAAGGKARFELVKDPRTGVTTGTIVNEE